ncbi:MAG: hypothetical protein U0174_05940 [Polyangiaceae bacterium]
MGPRLHAEQPNQPEVRWATPANALARIGNVLVFRDGSMPTVNDAKRLHAEILAVASDYPEDGAVVLHVTPDIDDGYPSEEVRDAFLQLLRSTRGEVRGVAYAILRKGLLGATVRTVARALFHAARIGKNGAVLDTLEEAATWASQRSLVGARDLASTWHMLGSVSQEASGRHPLIPPRR